MNPAAAMAVILVGVGAVGFGTAALFALVRRSTDRTVAGRTALARAASYLGLAAVLAASLLAGVVGIAVLLGVIAAVGLLEWARLASLPVRHVVATQVANVVVMTTIAWNGTASADVLVGGLAFVAALLPVARPDTSRAFRDFGTAAVGLIVITVMLVHGVALVVERGAAGAALVGAIALGCAASDVGAFLLGRRFGRSLLAPTLSPNKTRAGVVGNLLGAAVAAGIAAPALVPVFGLPAIAGLAVVVAVGAVWGDLLESAAKREFGVKDTGGWLPGFGGILDRIDSLLLAMPLVYWAVRLLDPASS